MTAIIAPRHCQSLRLGSAAVLFAVLVWSSALGAVTFTPLERFGLQGYSVAIGDYDRDGRLDVAVSCRLTDVIRLYHNDGGNAFTELKPFNSTPLTSHGTLWGDFGSDGWLDLVVANLTDSNLLYRSLGDGTFQAETIPGGGPYKHRGIEAADYDLDGNLDLIAVSDDTTRLLHNEGVSLQAIPVLPPNGGALWADLDRDLAPDLIFSENRAVYENRGSGNFEFKCQWVPWAGRAVAAGDCNADGLLDLAFASIEWEHPAVLCTNRGGFRFDTSAAFGQSGGLCCTWGDADNDGNLDLAVIEGDGIWLYCGDGMGKFVRQEVYRHADKVGLAWGDSDDDGDLDLVATDSLGQNMLFENNTNDSNFVKLRFEGRGKPGYSNCAAIGNQVELRDGSDTLRGYREITGGQGANACMDAPEAHFGAPAGDTFTVLVTWPASGIVDTIPGVIPPARLKIVENRRPGTFSLASPAKGTEVSRKPTLAWHRSVDPDGDTVTYDLWYGKDPSFAVHAEVKGLADTTWTPSALLDSATYYWKVLTIDREHRVISYRNHYTDTIAVDSLGAETWCNEKDWYFSATAAGIAEGEGRQPRAQISLSVGQNPARGAVRVSYTAAAGGFLEVFSADGRLALAQPVEGTGTLALGRSSPQGVYFIRLTADRQERTAKVVKLD